MTNKENYTIFCKNQIDLPLFIQPWWLNITCGNENWEVVLVNKGNHIVGALPYYKKNKYGFKGIGLPLLTSFMGPWIVYPKNQKYSKKLSFEKFVLQELFKMLPKTSFLNIVFHYSHSNWLPLYWLKYSQSTRYSYLINNLNNIDVVYKKLETKIRGDIKKAEKRVEVIKGNDYEVLHNTVKKTFTRKGIKMPYSIDLIKTVVQEAEYRKCGKVYYAKDLEGKIHAAIFIIWDNNTAYYLLGGGDEKHRNSGATSLLLWSAINDCSIFLDRFDFEGSMMEPIERFIRGFGGEQKPLNRISKINSKMFFLISKLYEFKKLFF